MTDQDLAADVGSSARRFLQDQWPLDGESRPSAVSAQEARRLWVLAADLGWAWIARRETAVETLRSAPVLAALFGELGRHPAPIAAADLAVWLPVLASTATATCLEPFLDGPRTASFALGAWAAGQQSPWAGVVLHEQLLASGSASLVPYADAADALIVAATVAQEPCFALVETAQPGVSVEPIRSYDRLERPGVTRFHDAAAVIICRGEQAVAAERIGRALACCVTAAELSGACAAAVTMAVEYVKARKQFGRAIGSFQAIKHLLADAWIDVYAMESAARSGARLVAEAVSPDEAAAAASMALSVALPASRRVMEAVLQAHGGIGFTLEYKFSWYFNRALARTSTYGPAVPSATAIGRALVASERGGSA